MKRVLLAAIAATMFITSACAVPLQSAVQVGDCDNATWVFISVGDKSLQGVYRCKETANGPVCQRAKIEE